MKNILYISGWLGAGRDSGTFRWLEKTYPEATFDCLAPGGTIDLTDFRRLLAEKLRRNPDTLIVANSYGGFLASFFPEQPAVWINPSLYPSRTIPARTQDPAQTALALSRQEAERDRLYAHGPVAHATPVISDSDELIPDHRENRFTATPAIIVPGGHHRLTDTQRTAYLAPAITPLLARQ